VLQNAVRQGDAPGLVALVVDRDGVLFEAAAGESDVARGAAMPADAIFSIASMTKPVTSVAAMMLYERGQLGLDDPVGMYLPEFAARELARFDAVNGSYVMQASTTPLTVRHLLSHTSGIGYSFCNSGVARLQRDYPGEEWELPLLDEPGTKWRYGPSTRVIGLLVEQISGLSLEAFFQTEIFSPLSMVDTSFAVPLEKQARLPTLHSRRADGSLQESPQDGVAAAPTPPFTGDGGLYSTARDYGRFMRMFLNGGTLDGARILSPSSVEMMGQNQIGSVFVEQQDAASPALTRPFPLGAGSDKFGIGFQITMADSGGAARSVGSLAWGGLFNTEFWIDPARGIAATLLMQVLPFYDEGAIRALRAFEAALYRELPAASR
jgi:CubicO group peptidase (beta-lactamase class C family)